MNNKYVIPIDDPDLIAFERLIADFHPWYRQFQENKEGKASYQNKFFYHRAFEQGPYPGIDDDYCPFAFTLFDETKIHNYLHKCQLFLETPYGRKRDKGIVKLKESFEELAMDSSSELMSRLKLLTEETCAIWLGGTTRDFAVDKQKFVTPELQKWVINKCEIISDKLMALSKSEELNFGELETLDAHGRYGVLAKLLIQSYLEALPKRLPGFVEMWLKVMENATADYEINLPRYIDVVLAHHLVKKLRSRPLMPSSPTDFIYKEISNNKFAKSRDLRSHFRWLFIKAWLYSYLNNYDLTLSEISTEISNEDKFFYMSDMRKLKDPEEESNQKEIQQIRFLDLKNNLSAWTNDKSENGYIFSQILRMSEG